MFNKGQFKSHSGKILSWKIECDDLTESDIECFVFMIRMKYNFCDVYGVPRGGIRLANHLKKYCNYISNTVLIVDDVLTTGSSMEKMKKDLAKKYIGKKIKGVVLFARGKLPKWINYVVSVNPEWWV